jgi:biotin carboxyl carrier protein
MRWLVDHNGEAIEVVVHCLEHGYEVALGGVVHRVELVPIRAGLAGLFFPDGRNFAVASQRLERNRFRLLLSQRQFEIRLRDPHERAPGVVAGGRSGPHQIKAPIPGRVVSVAVQAGAEVHAGQALLVLEAMKMENQICAEAAGRVQEVLVSPGIAVEGGQTLVVVA